MTPAPPPPPTKKGGKARHIRVPARLATRLMIAQALVIAVGAITLLLAATLVAPPLFRDHLAHSGEDDPLVLFHAEEAFASSFAIALGVGTLCALATAGLVSWFVARRVSQPVVELAAAAERVTTGDFQVAVPAAEFSSELQQLSASFGQMAQRLAETEVGRTRLMADLAHEIRTPLATLEAYVDGLEDGVVEPSAESWETMRGQVRRLRRLSDDLREVAAVEEHALHLNFDELDVSALVAESVAAAGPQFQAKGVTLHLLGGDAEVTVRGDHERLGQILANLLDNALRHAGTGGEVTVTVEESLAPRPGTVRVTVDDSGAGIAADQQDQVFIRFHRGDPSRQADGAGSGLGLTIARGIATEHGGTLTAEPNPGPLTGARFALTLPTL